MAESSDIPSLRTIYTEIDQSQLKIIWNNQCYEAQRFLVHKLKNRCERANEICNSISRANLILDSEIKTAQQELKSLTDARESLKYGNVELRKELITVKEKKSSLVQNSKETRYDNLWLECKNRFESIPAVKTLIDAEKIIQNFQNELNELKTEAEELNKEIRVKRNMVDDADKASIVELARYMRIERPAKLKLLDEKTMQVIELTKEIEDIKKRMSNRTENILKTSKDTPFKIDINTNTILDYNKLPYWRKSIHSDTSSSAPRLQIDDTNLDKIRLKLNQIKKTDIVNTRRENDDLYTRPHLVENNIRNTNIEKKPDTYISIYFKKTNYNMPVETHNYAKRKLINVLEDIKINNNDAYNLVSKADPEKLQPVTSISSEFGVSTKSQPIVSEEIEEIDMTIKEDIILPPSQFVDASEARASYCSAVEDVIAQKIRTLAVNTVLSQNQEKKKAVSFDNSAPVEVIELDEPEKSNEKNEEKLVEDNQNESINSATEETNIYADSNRIKEIMSKREKLDVSPQFVYSRNNILEDRTIVTSKYFKRNEQANTVANMPVDKNIDKKREVGIDVGANNKSNDKKLPEYNETNTKHPVPKEVDTFANKPEFKKFTNPAIGFLFNHNTQGLPNSLNVSINTTGVEDGEFEHCIDSSLLLSPKADVIMTNEIPPNISQEVPSFLTGLKRSAFPFFGQAEPNISKSDCNAQTQDGAFRFNFGSQEKKTRCGFLSMFK